MSIYIKDNNIWKQATDNPVKQSGVWKSPNKVYIKQSGVWKEAYSKGNPNLLHHWKLDESSGATTFIDSGVNAVNGNIYGTNDGRLTAGNSSAYGNYVNHTGNNASPRTGILLAQQFPNISSWSISVWCLNSISLGQYGNGNRLFLQDTGSNKLRVGLNGTYKDNLTTYTIFGTSTWRHVVITYDGSNLRAYIDGVYGDGADNGFAVSGFTPATENYGIVNMVQTGQDNNWTSIVQQFGIRNHRIYDIVLSQAQITDLYNNPDSV